jgi:hypothetical protein
LEHVHWFKQHLAVKQFIMQTKFQCFSKSEDELKSAPKNDAIIACIWDLVCISSYLNMCDSVNKVCTIPTDDLSAPKVPAKSVSHLSWVSIVTGYGLDSWVFPAKAGIFLFSTAFGAHPSSYSMGTRGSSPKGNAAGAWSWPFTSI